MATQTPDRGETAPLLQPPHSSQQEQEQAQEQPKLEQKQLSTRHAFAVLVSIQIGSGIFASPAQVDSNVPSPGVALLVWALGGLLSWAGAASFAELGAALPLNGGMQEYLRHVYGDTAAFLMAWIYIMAVKPSSMAIQSIVIAESVSSVTPLTPQIIKAVAVAALVFIVIINSINTKTTLRMGEAFTAVKILTVVLIVCGGFVAVVAHLADPGSRLSPSKDWYTRDWFHARTTKSESGTIDWSTIGAWERCGHYSAALYAGLWAYDGWDNANFVASEIRDPGRSLPQAIKTAMTVVLLSYELVNAAYYILLPWDTMSTSNAVAVAAASSLLGRAAGVSVTILVALSCAGSIASNIFSVGRLTVAASQRHYLPALFSRRGLARLGQKSSLGVPATPIESAPPERSDSSSYTTYDAPIYANALALLITLLYILTGSFQTLLTFVGMAEWVFYVSTVTGLIILRRREPQLERPYRPVLALPCIFVVVGTLVIGRSAIFAPVQSSVLVGLLIIGTLVVRIRR